MKALIKSSFIALLAPLALQAANVAEVVYEEPDGAVYKRGGLYSIEVGLELIAGDLLQTNDSTVILSLCEGSLLTAYPGTEVLFAQMSDGTVAVKLMRGEVLGDISDDCRMDVQTKAGVASVDNGVFGVLQNLAGNQGYTVQVRNLDGKVGFIGDPKLDTTNVAVSLIEPNERIEIAPGEEIIIRGVYYEGTEVFALTQEGASMAAMDADMIDEMREAVQQMSSVVLPEAPGEGDEPPPPPPSIIIEIPYEDIETASDKG
jgi:hypothetical protein